MPRFCFALILLHFVKSFVGFTDCFAIGSVKPKEDFMDY